MEQYTILIIIFGIIIFLILGLLYLINNILIKRQKVDFQFTTIIKILKERVILLEKIHDFLNKNTENEKKYLKEITNSIIELNKIERSTKENIKLIHQSNQILNKFTKLNEVYPQLNKNKKYNEFLEQVQLNHQRLNYAFDIYDKEVTIYMKQTQTKINSIISKIFKIKDYEHYNK